MTMTTPMMTTMHMNRSFCQRSRSLPRNKAIRVDELPAELLKTDSQTMAEVLCKITVTGEWPTDWRQLVFIASGTTDRAEHLHPY